MHRPPGGRAERRLSRRVSRVRLVLLCLLVPLPRSAGSVAPGAPAPEPPAASAAAGAPAPPPAVPAGLPLYARAAGTWWLEGTLCAGAVAPALARRETVRLEHARAEDRFLRLRLYGVPGQVGQLDEISVLAVDHDAGVEIEPDGTGWFHALRGLSPPVRAWDLSGADVLPAVSADDGTVWESAVRRRDPALAGDLRDGIEAEFTRPPGAARATLVVDATSTPPAADVERAAVALHGFETKPWFDAVLADTARARRVRESLAGGASLRILVRVLGGWEPQGALPESGPGEPVRRAVPLDLSRAIGGTVRVRLEGVPGFWRIDRVAIDCAPEPKVLVQEVRSEIARDREGFDIRGPLIAEDRTDYAAAPEDTVKLLFRTPPRSPGRARDFLARVTGWYCLDTPATGQPDRESADALETGPDAFARFAIQRMNEAIASGAGGGVRGTSGR